MTILKNANITAEIAKECMLIQSFIDNMDDLSSLGGFNNSDDVGIAPPERDCLLF